MRFISPAVRLNTPMGLKSWAAVGSITILTTVLMGCQWLGIRTYRIPTGSMEPTIKKGQLIYVRTIDSPADGDFKRGDLVVIRSPQNSTSVYARRVIGLPGDRVQVRADDLVVNGTHVTEPYATWTEKTLAEIEPKYKERLRELFDVGPVSIPSGTIYVLCDNRLDSPDSRKFGPLPLRDVVGFVMGSK